MPKFSQDIPWLQIAVGVADYDDKDDEQTPDLSWRITEFHWKLACDKLKQTCIGTRHPNAMNHRLSPQSRKQISMIPNILYSLDSIIGVLSHGIKEILNTSIMSYH